uniref:surface-adhesin E family protein n=1 Tax=Burkholderia anthina TaxID=179879 RepID=UPI001589DC56|nr:surface-adhesin E family protein [Burkholderia anthina]
MKTVICVAAALLVANSATAADWQSVSGVWAKGAAFSIDRSTIDHAGKLTKVWVKASFDTPQRYRSGNESRVYQSAISQYVFDCRSRQVAIVQSVTYDRPDGDGTPVESKKYPNPVKDMSEVVPGSIGAGLMQAVCRPA